MVSLCPRSILRTTRTGESACNRSPFGPCDQQAAARSASRPAIGGGFTGDRSFPDNLPPALNCARLADIAPVSRSYLKMLGAALVTPAAKAFGDARACLFALALTAVGALVTPLGHGVMGGFLFVLGTVVFACGAVIVSVATRTYRQLHTPPELLPRVMATVRFTSWGAIPVGALVAGAPAQGIGTGATLLVFAAAVFAALLLLVCPPPRPDRPTQQEVRPASVAPRQVGASTTGRRRRYREPIG